MNKEQFLEYVRETFVLDGTSQRLISSVTEYVCSQGDSEEDKREMLYAMLSPIGIEKEEIEQLQF